MGSMVGRLFGDNFSGLKTGRRIGGITSNGILRGYKVVCVNGTFTRGGFNSSRRYRIGYCRVDGWVLVCQTGGAGVFLRVFFIVYTGSYTGSRGASWGGIF